MAELSPGNSLPMASLVLLAAAAGALRVPANLRSVLSVEEPLFFAGRTRAGRGVFGVPIRSDHCYHASTWANTISLARGGSVRPGPYYTGRCFPLLAGEGREPLPLLACFLRLSNCHSPAVIKGPNVPRRWVGRFD